MKLIQTQRQFETGFGQSNVNTPSQWLFSQISSSKWSQFTFADK